MATHVFTVTSPDIDPTQLAAVANDLRVDVTRRVLPGSEVTVQVGEYVSEDPFTAAQKAEAEAVTAAEDELARQVKLAKRVAQAETPKPKAKAPKAKAAPKAKPEPKAAAVSTDVAEPTPEQKAEAATSFDPKSVVQPEVKE